MNQTPEGPDFSLADVAREGLIERPGVEAPTHDGTGRVDLSFTVHGKAEDGAALPPTQRGVRVSMIALVRPEVIAIGSQVPLRVCRPGMPNETLDAPHVMLTPKSSRIRRITSNVTRVVVVSAPIGMASGSITMSACAMP